MSTIAMVLLLSAPAHALEIRNTKDCKATEQAQEGAEELGLGAVFDEAIDGDYSNYGEWKKNRLDPMLDTFRQQFPLTPRDAGELPNYANFVNDFNVRINMLAYNFHQMHRHTEGSQRYEQAQSTAQIHLDAMKKTAAKFREDCIL